MKYSCHVCNNFIWFWYDLIRTNPDWRCFQQNYRGVVFCAEIKVLGMDWKITVIFYGPKETPEVPELGQEVSEEATSLGARLPTCGPLGHPLDVRLTPKIHRNTKNPRKNPTSEVLLPQASVATKNQSGAPSGTLPEAKIITGGHLHHPGGRHDEEGVVHPWGWGYVPVAMCLISLSLSLVLDMERSWCTVSFATIVGSYGVSPPLSSCDELSFTFQVSLLSDRILLWIWEHLMYVLRWDICGDNGMFYWFT